MGVYCAVYGCLSAAQKDKERSFFRFPTDELRCKQWIQAACRPDLLEKTTQNLNRSYVVCDLHFQASDRQTKKLKSCAVPSLNLPSQYNDNPTKATQTVKMEKEDLTEKKDASTQACTTIVYKSIAQTQTPQYLANNTPLKRKLETELKEECKKRKMLEKQLECALNKKTTNNMSPILKKIIDLQNKLKRSSTGNRYDKDYKLFALNIYFASPMAYKILAKTLTLPSERTLRRLNITMGTKLYPNVLKCLESKSKNLQKSEKYCIICADEISLKHHLHYEINEDKIIGFHEINGVQTVEPATHAFVIMARGILSDWNQPLAFCLLAENKYYPELNTWLDDVISKIINIGFRVVAFVSDQGAIFSNLAEERNVSIDQTHFFINENKIYYIFDVPHLIRSVRNNLIKYDFEFSDDDGSRLTAKWQDIQALFRLDCQRDYRLAPKLTESHVSPNKFDKLKVKYASQVFSNTVAAAMNCLVEFGRLQPTSLGTVKFVSLMDKAFDVLNSSVASDPNKHKTAFTASPHQVEVLNRLDAFLSNVTVHNNSKKDVSDPIKCMKGLKITLNSIRNLSRDLKSEGVDSILTCRLNKDPLDDLFGSIKQQGGNFKGLTPVYFSRSFGKLFMTNILKFSQNSSCSDDLDQLLMNIDVIANVNMEPENENSQQDEATTLEVAASDYSFDLPESNVLLYVCGFLLKKCFDIHKCDGMKQYVQKNEQINEDIKYFTKWKSFNKNNFINPPESFVTFIKSLDEHVKFYFQYNILTSIGSEILKQMSDITFSDSCTCFPNLYLKTIFVRFRIFNVMQTNNKIFADKTIKDKPFSVGDLE